MQIRGGIKIKGATHFRAPPVLYLPLTASGARMLSRSLTINGTTIGPGTGLVELVNASDLGAGPGGTPEVGNALVDLGAGSLTYEETTPAGVGRGGEDVAVTFDGTNRLEEAAASFAIGSDDFILVVAVRPTAPSQTTVSKWGGDGGFRITTSSTSIMVVLNKSGTAIYPAVTVASGAWYLAVTVVDFSGSAIVSANGNAGAAVALSTGPITDIGGDAAALALGAITGGTAESTDTVALLGIWKGAAWLDTHLQPAVVREILHRYAGFEPQIGAGAAQTFVRDDVATITRIIGGETSLHTVGADWPRVVDVEDANGVVSQGALIESTSTCLVTGGRNCSTGWANDGTAVITASDALSPRGILEAARWDLGNGNANGVYIGSTAHTADGPAAAGIWIKRISTSGTLLLSTPWGIGYGHWTVDLSACPDRWIRLTEASPYVNVIVSFKAIAAGNCGFWCWGDGAAVSVHAFGATIEDRGALLLPTSTILADATNEQRLGDALNIDPANVPAGEWTIELEFLVHTDAPDRMLFDMINSGNGAERSFLYMGSTATGGSIVAAVFKTGEPTRVTSGAPNSDDGLWHRASVSMRTGMLSLMVDGVEIGTNPLAILPTGQNTLTVGKGYATLTANLCGYIRNFRVFYYARR